MIDDEDQYVTFLGLTPNVLHTITVCARSQRDIETNEETCKSVSAKTFPLTPLSVRSLSVNQADMVATRRTVTFTHSNPESSGVIGFSVRVIRNDAIVQQQYVYPSGFGLSSYTVTFNGLQPFTAYEVWVIPYNNNPNQPVGEAVGIGFTTPAAVNVAVQPLSGSSAMLDIAANAPGDLIVERRTSTGSFVELGRVRATDTNARRVVIDNLDAAQVMRVTWKLAFLSSRSAELSVAPLTAGTPEFLSLSSRAIGLTPLPVRHTAVLLPTTTSRAEYVLQAKYFGSAWQTLSSTGSSLLLMPLFEEGQPVTLSGSTQVLYTDFRVCQRLVSSLKVETLRCSPTESFKSAGATRFALP